MNLKHRHILFAGFFLVVLSSFQLKSTAIADIKPLKVISYNIWNGFDWGKDTDRKRNFIDWVNTQKPDVFALQELCGYTQEKLLEDAKKMGA